MYEKQWDILKKSAERGSLPHALLFSGQKGIGKKDFALKLSESLTGPFKNNPDFILLEAEKGEIKIAQIKELIQKLSFKPYSSNFKVAIVDNAHSMNKESQNCFLKFLEEPTEKTHLILITAFPFLLLDTILSRIQKIRFYNKEVCSEAEDAKIENLSMAEKFKLAKEMSELNVEETLDSWVKYFRQKMLSLISEKESKKIASLIKEIEQTKRLLSTTNTNKRLALEILLMNL
jgi:DNA polymerase III delta prime subunit